MSVLSRTCVIYARVSSKEQEHEGYSIQAQLTLLRDYAAQEKLQILQEFVDVETAKVAGRPSFNAMLAYLKNSQRVIRCSWRRPTAFIAT